MKNSDLNSCEGIHTLEFLTFPNMKSNVCARKSLFLLKRKAANPSTIGHEDSTIQLGEGRAYEILHNFAIFTTR